MNKADWEGIGLLIAVILAWAAFALSATKSWGKLASIVVGQ